MSEQVSNQLPVMTSSQITSVAKSSWQKMVFATGTTGLLIAFVWNAEIAHTLSAKIDWEGAVRKDIVKMIEDEEERRGDGTSIGPSLIRLGFHTSGTYDRTAQNGGSNGACMRFIPEAHYEANQGLSFPRALLEPLQAKYGMSFSDLWTFAAKVAVEEAGGPVIPWRPGRTDADDGSKSVPDGRLPDATQGAAHLRSIFNRMGLNDQEIVALSGGHSMGFCHLDTSGFVGPWTFAPNSFSNEYFRLLVEEKWAPKKTHKGKIWRGPLQYEDSTGNLMMLPTDMALMEDPAFKKWVIAYKEDEELFSKHFAAAFSKLLELGVPFPKEKTSGGSFLAQMKNMLGL